MTTPLSRLVARDPRAPGVPMTQTHRAAATWPDALTKRLLAEADRLTQERRAEERTRMAYVLERMNARPTRIDRLLRTVERTITAVVVLILFIGGCLIIEGFGGW